MAKYGKKSDKLNLFLNILIYVCAAACIILGGILLVRHFTAAPDYPADIVSETTTATTTTTAATTTTEAITTTTAATTPAETSATTAFSPPSPSDLDYDKTFFADFLFIGDSISTGLSGYNYLPAENVFAKQGFTPNNIVEKELSDLTVFEKASEMSPETIVIMLGTNGLAYISTDVMARAYGDLIDNLSAASPDSRIVILSIPPVTQVHEAEKPENLAIINDYNGKLKSLAEDKGAVFIDINTLLADENGYTADIYAEADGLHLKGEAYKRILSAIEENLSETE